MEGHQKQDFSWAPHSTTEAYIEAYFIVFFQFYALYCRSVSRTWLFLRTDL